MATQTIKTIIKLKQKTYSAWADTSKGTPASKTAGAGEGAYYVPYYGEICLCEITAANQGTQTSPPTVLFKVGNGSDYFCDLNWASALASDIYDWAKASDVKFENNHLLFIGKANETIKDVDLSALSIDIPELTVTQTTTDVLPTGDTVAVVTNVLNSDGDYNITVTRHKVPTKEYVDNAIGAANAAVNYLGILVEPATWETIEIYYSQICGQLSTAASKGDFYRAGFTFGASTTFPSFPGFHTGDLIIAEKDEPEQDIDGSNWSVIHCHDGDISAVTVGKGLTGGGYSGDVEIKLGDKLTNFIDNFDISNGKLWVSGSQDIAGFAVVDPSILNVIGETHYLNGKIKIYDGGSGSSYSILLPSGGGTLALNSVVTASKDGLVPKAWYSDLNRLVNTYTLPDTEGTVVLAEQTDITYILDCN